MQKLIARTTILHDGKLYAIGDELPANNPQMVEAWSSAGTAVWKDDEEVKPVPVKAVARTAEPGLPGTAAASESEDGDDLVGKVPKTAARSKTTKK